MNGGEKEARSFHFFCQMTVPQLTGFFGDDLWNYLVLRATHHEPAIRHAVIALGSLHERFLAHDGLVAKSKPELYRDDFALQEYTAAIRTLVQPLVDREHQPVDVCLLACILFACFENMQGSYGPAIAHINSGSKILLEMQHDPQTEQQQHGVLTNSAIPYAPIDVLEGTFMRLKLQVMDMLGGTRWAISDQSVTLNKVKTFSSVADARQSLVWNWHYTINMGHLVGQPRSGDQIGVQITLQEWREQALARLDEWGAKLDQFLEDRGSGLTDGEMHGVKVLQMHSFLAWTTLSAKRRPRHDQTAWDEFRPVFEKIVSLGAEIVGLADPVPVRMAVFSLDMGVTGALYEVASRCRHPAVRRKAIAVLKHGSRQEGIWNSFLTAKVAERVVEIEEQGCGEVKEEADVPDWARISDVSPAFDPVARKATLTYSRPKSKYDLVRKTVEEVIEW